MFISELCKRKTVVMIISDGYDTGSSKIVAEELEKLKKRNCKIVWLNPLLGWENYAPVASSMKACFKIFRFVCSL